MYIEDKKPKKLQPTEAPFPVNQKLNSIALKGSFLIFPFFFFGSSVKLGCHYY